VNTGTLPKGGIIISIASTQGYGYQPLVAAAGTAIVSVAGSISQIAVGTTGSGYRAQRKYEIQTTTSTTTSIGSTIINITPTNSILEILNVSNTGSNCVVSIGTYLSDVTITGITTDSLVIAGGGAPLNEIPSDSQVLVAIHNSPVGIVNVGVANSSLGITTVTNIGFAQINQGSIDSVTITSPGTAYTTSNIPVVVFDDPISYTDLPMLYSSSSPVGVGTGATVNVVVGQGSSIIDFEITNYGYAYNKKEILTIETDGLYGVPLDNNVPYTEFQITVSDVYDDAFSGWIIGDLQIIDPIDQLFDGIKTLFPISINGERLTIRAKQGSNIDVQATLIITLNDVIQIPGQGFKFNGGSAIRFTSPPKPGDTAKIMFYSGTAGVDTQFTDILSLVKDGDRLTINSDDIKFQQTERIINEIISTDTTETNLYNGFSISENTNLLRAVNLCQQRNDIFINGKKITKDREIYNYSFKPTIKLLTNVTPDSTEIFIDNGRPYLGSDLAIENKAFIISEDSPITAEATALVSSAGTISSIIVENGGTGYTTTPSVVISQPIGFGTTVAALGSASVVAGAKAGSH
jgi:hypothetical protein